MCGQKLPAGLKQCEKLPELIFTPATKAEIGAHDENISFERSVEILGAERAEYVRDWSMDIFEKAGEYAEEKGMILADTKFEWGVADGKIILIDEVLTPDSSRFWPADLYEPGRAQASYDKQYVRDWLDESGWDHEPPSPELPADVVRQTAEKYLEACRLLTGTVPA